MLVTFLIWTAIISFGFALMGFISDAPLGKEYDNE